LPLGQAGMRFGFPERKVLNKPLQPFAGQCGSEKQALYDGEAGEAKFAEPPMKDFVMA
jgi:hypothetical protein